MKIKKFEKLKFEPVDVRLTFETQAELAEFYAIFNYSPITECLQHLSSYDIRNELDVPHDVYRQPHDRLRSNLKRA